LQERDIFDSAAGPLDVLKDVFSIGEARGAVWSEIDLKQAIWTIPGSE
jgi:hypothetical protein